MPGLGKTGYYPRPRKGSSPEWRGVWSTLSLLALIGKCLSNAKATGNKLYVAWLDLANAFGSVSHESLRSSGEAVGLPDSLHVLFSEIYADATSTYQTSILLLSVV